MTGLKIISAIAAVIALPGIRFLGNTVNFRSLRLRALVGDPLIEYKKITKNRNVFVNSDKTTLSFYLIFRSNKISSSLSSSSQDGTMFWCTSAFSLVIKNNKFLNFSSISHL